MRWLALCAAAALLLPIGAALQPAEQGQDYPYPSYAEVSSALAAIAREHPDLAEVASIARTYEGREVWALRLGHSEGKPSMLVMGGHHAREPASVVLCMRLAEFLVDGYVSNASARWTLDNREVWIVPLVNPDGYEFVLGTGDWSWRKNRRPVDLDGDGALEATGVDLNRNYDHLWGVGSAVHDPASIEYCGPAPFSETETRGIRDLAERELFDASVSFHSYGEQVFYPWNNGAGSASPMGAGLATLAAEVAERNGYAAMEGHELYPTNGDSDDWLYANLSALPLTIELGTSFDPTAQELDAIVSANLEAALYAIEMAGRAGNLTGPDWTLLVYMAADNDLGPQGLDDLNEMEMAFGSTDARVVVLYDGPGMGDSKIYQIAHDADAGAVTSPEADDHGEVIDPVSREANMFDPATLDAFLDWGLATRAGRRNALILWDHGADVLGGLCVDKGMWLGTADALAVIRGRGLDFVGLDLCWGAAMELASGLVGEARVLVASELEEPESGWTYMEVLDTLSSDPTPEGLGAGVVNAYRAAYFGYGYATIASFSLPLLADAADGWAGLSTVLRGYLYHNGSAIAEARNLTGPLWNSKPDLVDLRTLCSSLATADLPGIVAETALALDAKLVTATQDSFSSNQAQKALGLYVYHPVSGGAAPEYAQLGAAAHWRDYLVEVRDPVLHPMVVGGAPPQARNTTGPYVVEAWLNDPTPENATVTLHAFDGVKGATEAEMAYEGRGLFSAGLPGRPDGTFVEYWMEATDSAGFRTRFPATLDGKVSFVVDAHLDLAVEAVSTSSQPLAGSATTLLVRVSNLGMEPCDALVEVTGAGSAWNETVFVNAERNATLSHAWTPTDAGQHNFSVAVTAVGAAVPDENASNDAGTFAIVVAEPPVVDGEGTMRLLLLANAIVLPSLLALSVYVIRRRKRARAIEARIERSREYVEGVAAMGFDITRAREVLYAARINLNAGKFDIAEKLADRSAELATESLRAEGGVQHG